MTTELVTYTCPDCGYPVQFYPGFKMLCKTRNNNPSHAFEPDKETDNGQS